MRTAFLAMSNHLNVTRSTDFLIAHLRDFFGDVAVIPHERAWLELPKAHWDLIVVFQKRYSPQELEAFPADRVVLVPMYDASPMEEVYWRKYRAFKVFCFSSTMEQALASYGLEAWGARYYPELPDSALDWSGLKGFFWPRSPSIDQSLIRTLTAETEFESMHLHSTWFEDQADYRAALERSNVFFAPRPAEGIGHSFIEAMALGHCVVAADRPTMNEYIRDGVNGLLYDPDRPRSLDFSRSRELGLAARASSAAGRKAWLDALPDIRRFLEEPARGFSRKAHHPFIALKGRAIARLRYFPWLLAAYRSLRSIRRP